MMTCSNSTTTSTPLSTTITRNNDHTLEPMILQGRPRHPVAWPAPALASGITSKTVDGMQRSLHAQCRSSQGPVTPAMPPPRTDGHSYTLNLSSVQLSQAQLQLLDKGLMFIPTYRSMPRDTLYKLQNRLARNLKLKDYFRDRDQEDQSPLPEKFVLPKTWTPPDSKVSPTTLEIIQDIFCSTEGMIQPLSSGDRISLPNTGDNLTKAEREALAALRDRSDIIIKPADKGSATVVMDTQAYLQEAYRQLNNDRYYRRLPSLLLPKNCETINGILSDMLQAKAISEDQFSYLKATDTDRPRYFYILPKIHKPRSKWPQPDRMPEGRPIVSDSGSESCRVAAFIDSFIKPLSTSHPSYIQDTYAFVRKVNHFRIPRDAYLVTGDVTALYTNMTHDRIIDTVSAALRDSPVPNRPDRAIIELLDFTLRSNDFLFNDEVFLQICGTAMGKGYAPSLADLYLAPFDNKATSYHIVPLLYSRFLDDIFLIWRGTEQQLLRFEQYLNSLIEGIKITLTYSRESVDFLDTTVYKSLEGVVDNTEAELLTKVFFKSTDTHQLLHKASFHPRHTCRGVLKSQFLRFKRLSSSRQDYDAASYVLTTALAKRNYSRRMMRSMKSQIWKSSPTEHLRDTRPIFPIVIPYNVVGSTLAHAWRQAINKGEWFRSSYKLVTAYTTGANLRKILIRSLFSSTRRPYRSTPRTPPTSAPGCGPCPSTKCRAGAYVRQAQSFSSSSNGRRFTIGTPINCKSSHLIYLITCTKCHMQYVGETSRQLAERLTDHLSSIRLRKPTPVGLHFNLPGHTHRHLSLLGIERQLNPSTRKTKELVWQTLLQTAHPHGFNHLNKSIANKLSRVVK